MTFFRLAVFALVASQSGAGRVGNDMKHFAEDSSDVHVQSLADAAHAKPVRRFPSPGNAATSLAEGPPQQHARHHVSPTVDGELAKHDEVAEVSGRFRDSGSPSGRLHDSGPKQDTKQDMMVDRMDQMVSKPLKSIEHGVQGDVSLNKGIVMIKGFHYDGKAPDAVFAVSSTGTEPTKTMDKSKWKILTAGKSFGFEDAPVEGQNVATSAGVDVKLPVPQGFHPKWLAVYCRKFGVNFGHASLDNVKQDAEQDMKQAPVTTATTKETAVVQQTAAQPAKPVGQQQTSTQQAEPEMQKKTTQQAEPEMQKKTTQQEKKFRLNPDTWDDATAKKWKANGKVDCETNHRSKCGPMGNGPSDGTSVTCRLGRRCYGGADGGKCRFSSTFGVREYKIKDFNDNKNGGCSR